MRIFINPGHGGTDPGACGNGLREADVAFNIARRVESYLQDVGYDVKVFQLGGVADDLETICDESNAWDADVFVSIHCNAFDGNANGTSTFHWYNSHPSRKLANCIHNQIVDSLPVQNRDVQQEVFFVLINTDCPAALVETAFIDNPHDAALLRDRQDDFARAIARGITNFFAGV